MASNEADWVPSPRVRAAISKRLAAAAPAMTATALADMATKYAWIKALDPDYRSWINVIVRTGVDGFVSWFERGASGPGAGNIFDSAPRPLQRQVSLQQTLDLIRSTIASVELHVSTQMPRGDRAVCKTAILHYAREVAFDAAEVYAHAAETRGAWDARVEAMVIDAVIRGDASETVLSRASALGWSAPAGITVVIGDLNGAKDASLRRIAARAGIDALLAPQGERLVVLLGGSFSTDADAVAATAGLSDAFGPGPIVVGPVVHDLASTVTSARAALAGRRAVAAWPAAPRPVLASDLLPERALMGDGHARRALADHVFKALEGHGGDLLETLEVFFETGSIEGTSRRLFIHANTARYRLGRVEDVTGFSPLDQRDAYALRLGLSLGRILS
ncbi:PucR family transcriptional regulator [Propioniciclava tarda]|nr:helix-turn-helix domain-containing protein [Propioniciclava tarda]SMO52783.1 PucR C-terminal helix-turn-helix domain-containing protein [Propioniciclava tarda]